MAAEFTTTEAAIFSILCETIRERQGTAARYTHQQTDISWSIDIPHMEIMSRLKYTNTQYKNKQTPFFCYIYITMEIVGGAEPQHPFFIFTPLWSFAAQTDYL